MNISWWHRFSAPQVIILPDHPSPVVPVHRCSRLLEPDRASSARTLVLGHICGTASPVGMTSREMGEPANDLKLWLT
jgi:hypothetical protein